MIRPDSEGFSAIDIWTGKMAVIAMTPPTGMPQVDAEHLAELLYGCAEAGAQAVLQQGRARYSKISHNAT
jgi:hypothetical protein